MYSCWAAKFSSTPLCCNTWLGVTFFTNSSAHVFLVVFCRWCPTPRACPLTTSSRCSCSSGLACRRCAGAACLLRLGWVWRHLLAAVQLGCLLHLASKGTDSPPQPAGDVPAPPRLLPCSAASADEKAAEEKEEAQEVVSGLTSGERGLQLV